MKNLSRVLLGVLALAMGAGATSCQKGTYLEVEFKGAGLPPVNHINFTMTLGDQSFATDDLPKNAPAGHVLALPTSAAFQLNGESGPLTLTAKAVDDANNVIAQVTGTTTIMHAKTWTVTVDFATGTLGTDGGADMDAATMPDLGVVTDAADDGAPLVTVIDGGIDGDAGCEEVTVQATESVSLDYNSSGQDMDSGNMLWAYLGPAEQYIGWMKFGIKFIPHTAHLTKATLNLFLSQTTGSVPTLAVDYSSVDGWTRKSKASDVSNDAVLSIGGPYLMPNAAPASTPYELDVTNHNWALDVADGNITLGIANTSVAATALTSKIEFYGVNHTASPDPNRPTLDLEFCE